MKSFSQRLLSLLGISYESEGDSQATIAMTDVPGGTSTAMGTGLLPKNLRKRYKVARVLGYGGYGVVYLARDLVIGRLVALKILKKNLTSSDQIYGHFLQEARIAGQLDHENIVVIYNVEEEDESACIVMEYLSEGSLANRLSRDGAFELRDALRVAEGILEGLSVAHDKRVIHRDIKPENILFDPKGRPKISDFGIAHLPVEEGGFYSDSEYSAVGTPSYMAPEQLKGSADIDQRADLYSVGAILYEMLTLRKLRLYPKDADLEKIVSVLEENDPLPLRKLRKDLKEGVLEFVDRLICLDRKSRYGNAMDAIQDLRKLLQQEEQEQADASVNEDYETSKLALLEDVLRLLLVDGIMSAAERRELERRSERLNVSVAEARSLEEKVRREMGLPSLDAIEAFESAVTAMVGIGDLSEKDFAVLSSTAERLGIGMEEREMIQKLVLENQLK